MRVAVVAGGDIRTFVDCFPSLESNILRYNNCDLYLHFYDEPSTADAIKLLSPKKYIVEDKQKIKHDIDPLCFSHKPPETDPVGVFFQWRSIKTAFSLIEEDYDVVLKVRYDIKYTNPLILKNYDFGVLNVPSGGDWRGGLFDMVAWGSKSIMCNYCSLYDRINSYVTTGTPCHSELLNLKNNQSITKYRHEYTIVMRRQFDRPFIEDRIFTIR